MVSMISSGIFSKVCVLPKAMYAVIRVSRGAYLRNLKLVSNSKEP